MTTRANELTERSLSALGISAGPFADSVLTLTLTSASSSSRASRVLALISDQVHNHQVLLDSTFAASATISYHADKLAEEFNVPVREILRAFTQALLSDQLPPCSRITSDHRILITFVPSTIPERLEGPQRP